MAITIGNYREGIGEYNLFNMCKATLLKAFEKHYYGKGGVNKVATAMGISANQVYSLLDKFDLRDLLDKKIHSFVIK